MTPTFRHRLRALAFGLAIAAALGGAGCGQGPDPDARAPGAAANEYFPLVTYYRTRPLDPSLPPAAEWLAKQG